MKPKGGKREGAGRKKKFATQLKERILEEQNGEAAKSLDFCVQLRDEPSAEKGLRLAAATEIMDRVWGKSKTRNEFSGPGGGPLKTSSGDLDKILEKMTPQQIADLALAHVKRSA